MKERPILFKGEMVRAILDGRKTQTRRVVRPQPDCRSTALGHVASGPCVVLAMREGMYHIPCPYGQPGDRLRVKENSWIWCEKRKDGTTKTGRQKWRYIPIGQHVVYCATQEKPVKPLDNDLSHCWRLKVARFMPRWASRITLEIVWVSVERVQDITEDDAIAEGIKSFTLKASNGESLLWGATSDQPEFGGNAKTGYEILWDSINAKTHHWAGNPWVWVIEFKRIDSVPVQHHDVPT